MSKENINIEQLIADWKVGRFFKGKLWDFYPHTYRYLLHPTDKRLKQIESVGYSEKKIEDVCNEYDIKPDDIELIKGIVSIFMDGYLFFLKTSKEENKNLDKTIEALKAIDINSIQSISVKHKTGTISIKHYWLLNDLLPKIKEMQGYKTGHFITGKASPFLRFVRTYLFPFYQFAKECKVFETHAKIRSFIIDLCETFEMDWSVATELPETYLEDRFKEFNKK